jgi:hypothetical protein
MASHNEAVLLKWFKFSHSPVGRERFRYNLRRHEISNGGHKFLGASKIPNRSVLIFCVRAALCMRQSKTYTLGHK